MSEKIGKWKTKDYLVLGSLLIVAAGASVIVYNKLKITLPVDGGTGHLKSINGNH